MVDNQYNEERRTHDFDPKVPETFTSAHEQYKQLRQKCPVAYSQTFGGFWALMKYDDVFNVLTDPKTYITSVQNIVPKVATTGRRPPLHLDPPEHTPYRVTINRFFTEEKMKEMEPHVQHVIQTLIQPIIDAGGGDFSADFGQKLPGNVLAKFFNLSPVLTQEIKDVTTAYNKALQRTENELVQKTSLQLYDIAKRIIAQRKEEPMDPSEDVVCALLNQTYKGEPLPDDLVLGTIRQLIVIGMIAPSIFVGNMMVHLSENQDIQNELRKDPSLIPAAVEEYLRLYTPYRGFARTANRDVEIRGHAIKKDEPIAVVFASANRDEEVFPNSDQFILNRSNIKDHVAFGRGPHRCPGAPLARMMLRTTLEQMLSMTKKIEVDGEIEMTRWPEWGTLSVPIKVVPA